MWEEDISTKFVWAELPGHGDDPGAHVGGPQIVVGECLATMQWLVEPLCSDISRDAARHVVIQHVVAAQSSLVNM